MKLLLSTLTILGCMVLYSHAQGTPCTAGTITGTWTDLPYGNTLNSPTPVGFDTEILPGTDDQVSQRPCIQVNFPAEATGSRYISVLVESRSRVCVGIPSIGPETRCGSENFFRCDMGVASSLQVAFTCDSSCDQNDSAFLYRILTDFSDMDDEDFCETMVNVTYPSSLQPSVTPPTVDPNPIDGPSGSGTMLSPFVLGSILLMTLLALLFM